MSGPSMLMPDAAVAQLRRRWPRLRAEALLGTACWPEEVALKPPTQKQAEISWHHFGKWISTWQSHRDVTRREVSWSRLGSQCLPEAWALTSISDVAKAIGQSRQWNSAERAFAAFSARWPDQPSLLDQLARRYFDQLADTDVADLLRLMDVLDWLHRNPCSGLYPRQIPVAGIDSKWLHGYRRILGDLLMALGAAPAPRFEQRAGLRTPAETVHIRLLDPELRSRVAGIGDLVIPVAEFQQLDLPVRQVLIIENLQTGLACGDLPGTLLVMAKGYALEFLRGTPWLVDLPVSYWGDIDSHGLVILHKLRSYLPNVRSLLMDEVTMLGCPSDRRGSEQRVHRASLLTNLTTQEQELYTRMRNGQYGPAVRLEQERIDWSHAWAEIQRRMNESA